MNKEVLYYGVILIQFFVWDEIDSLHKTFILKDSGPRINTKTRVGQGTFWKNDGNLKAEKEKFHFGKCFEKIYLIN